jgi:methenyltetrahydromethanopterin cyclohydrolase
MVLLSRVFKEKPEGTKQFPIYKANTLESGKAFAEASMGFLGAVEYGLKGNELIVRTTTIRPVLATMGCQLAGWTVGDTMISGSVRLVAKKPSSIFEKINFGLVPKLHRVACVEGGAPQDEIISELKSNKIEYADILWTREDSMAQYVNIPARAIETAIFRLFFMTDLNKFRIRRAISTVTTTIDLKTPATELNDAIRFNGNVMLSGDFGGFKEFEEIVTSNTKFASDKFGDVMKEYGSVADCPLGLFSIGKLTIVDAGKTRVYQ